MKPVSKLFKIYCLKHPQTLEIKYIGRTTQTLKKKINPTPFNKG